MGKASLALDITRRVAASCTNPSRLLSGDTRRRAGLKLLSAESDIAARCARAGQLEQRRLDVALITRGLKELADLLGVPVIILSQLNGELTRRSDPRPQLADLAGMRLQDLEAEWRKVYRDSRVAAVYEDRTGPPCAAGPAVEVPLWSEYVLPRVKGATRDGPLQPL